MADIMIPLSLLAISLVILVLNIIILIRTRLNNNFDTRNHLDSFEKTLDKNQIRVLDEFSRNREDFSREAKESRDDLHKLFTNFAALFEDKFKGIIDLVGKNSKDNREELAVTLRSFDDNFTQSVNRFNDIQKQNFDGLIAKQEDLTVKTENKLEKMRENIEQKLRSLQEDNNSKLEKMRETVDEKLHKTLESRLGESFKMVSERLEAVQKGLGEMQSLATGVGDLKKVLSNVKTKGVLGEYQLENILEQLLTIEQYGKNVKTKMGSNDSVEFAVKIPNKDDSTKILWLPIDAKFPSENYEILMNAYDKGEVLEIDKAKKALEQTIKQFAKDIKSKYIDPPNTTDFAIMFLPFEGLYAEVLRINGLFEMIQREYKITIAGPTTISAFLSSLQMGFRTLAVEKRTSEIWELLGAVKTEFGKFGEILEKTKNKLDQASKEIDNAGARSRVIEKKLKNVQLLPQQESIKLLEDNSLENID
ncbi:MAG: DNA recombination protein RmuC [Calditrichaeota bacterium]|nr:MAG: DNA recombination protein RmuC [Calditrichota bacterium]